MHISHFHSWDVTPQEAIQIQKQIRERVIPDGKVSSVRLVAGADVAYDKETNTTYAAVVILRMPQFEIIETHIATTPTTFPYIPGLLSFREAPALLKAFEKVHAEPDVFFVDGHGLSHPRSAGIASHIGVLIDRPVIGCAKSLLTGSYREPGLSRGSVSSLYNQTKQVIGAVIRTRDTIKPVFVSIGHRLELPEAIRLTMACGKGYRIPEPTRQADLFVEKAKRELKQIDRERFRTPSNKKKP